MGWAGRVLGGWGLWEQAAGISTWPVFTWEGGLGPGPTLGVQRPWTISTHLPFLLLLLLPVHQNFSGMRSFLSAPQLSVLYQGEWEEMLKCPHVWETQGQLAGARGSSWAPGQVCGHSKIPSPRLLGSLGWRVVAMTPKLQRGVVSLMASGRGADLHPQPHWDLLGLKGAEMEGTARWGHRSAGDRTRPSTLVQTLPTTPQGMMRWPAGVVQAPRGEQLQRGNWGAGGSGMLEA